LAHRAEFARLKEWLRGGNGHGRAPSLEGWCTGEPSLGDVTVNRCVTGVNP
jgi:hypothetical protein